MTIALQGRTIGSGQKTFVVAEIGLNHNGSLELAKDLIMQAKACGADAVKFQKRDLKSLYKEDIYNDPNKDSQSTVYLFDIFSRYELKEKEMEELKKFADSLGILFFCTPFDIASADFLQKLDVPLYKVASADLTNLPLLEKLTATKKPLILSTGMSTIEEMDTTVAFLKKKKAQFMLLHCIGAYPPAFKDINLRMIDVLQKRYKVPIGYSGHERGITIASCAVAMGACVIEKHFTLDRSMEGPDHNISLMPEGFKKMVERIRIVEQAIGTGIKSITRGESLSREVFAKSLIAKRMIKKGETVTADMIDVKVPGKGLNPQYFEKLVGLQAKRDIEKNDYFTILDL